MGDLSKEKFDVFLSYRREGGFETARHLYDLLTRDGYSVSFDLDTLRNGRFDAALLSRIDECNDFIIVLSRGCFDRTLDLSFPPENDWLRQELSYALKRGKNIVPIMLAGFDKFPDGLPDDVKEVAKMNGPEYSQGYFDSFYAKLKSFLKSKQVSEKVLLSADVVFSSSSSPVRVFVTVPARNKSFVGREDELVKLKSICESGHIPLITGPGGVGKTELAYEFAHRHKEEYLGGCFLVPMEQALTWQDAFRFMLDVPAPECTTVGEWLTEGTKWADKAKNIIPGMVPELLSVRAKHGKVLLILDNVENSNLIDNIGLGDAFVYGWPRNVHAIATMRHLTREFAEEDTVKVFPLENLGEKAALKLVNAKCPPRGSGEQDAALDLVKFLDYHAWSVELVASEIALTYKRGGSYRRKLSSFKGDPTLMAHGRSLRKSTESNAIDLLQPTLCRIKEDEINGESLIALAQVAALFPANGVSSRVLAHLWDEMFPSVSQEMPYETVFSILRDYAIFRQEDASATEMSWTGIGGVRRDVSMHRFTRGALQVSLGDKKAALIKEVCLMLLDYRDFSIDDWIDLADDSELFTWCPFEKFGNDDVVTLLTRHPECVSKFDVDTLPNMQRARLFARRPELVGEHSLYDLGSGALWFIAANQPKLIPRINLELLTPEDWSFLLSFQPQCATLCDLTRFSARDWCRLLRHRPAFASRCDFKFFNEANWTDLIEERPEFSEKVDLESFCTSNVRRILALQPKLATRTLMRRLDWQDLKKIFCQDINSIDVYGSDNIRTQQWLSLIDSADFDDAGIAHLCDIINLEKFSPNDFCTLAELCFSKVYDKKYTFSKRQVEFQRMLKIVEGHAHESFLRFSHSQKVRLAAIFPGFFPKMNQDELNVHDRILAAWINADISSSLDCSGFDKDNWLSLLLFRPDFADKCDFAYFTSDDWAILLSHDLSLAKHCDFTRLDGAFWRIFAIGRFSFSELVDKCPRIFYEYDFSKVDVFLAKILDGSFDDEYYALGYEYDLFTRGYTQSYRWYENRSNLQFSRYEEGCVMPDVQFYWLMRRAEIYTRVCECLGPSFPEKFDFSLIKDRRAISVIAKALAQRDDELSLLENVDWTLVGDYARDAWREYSTSARKLLDLAPAHDPQKEVRLPRRWKGWTRDYGEDERCFKMFSPQEGSRIRQITWEAYR